MDASEIYSNRLNAKEVIFPKQGELIFPIADGRIKNPRRRSGTENIHFGTASTNSRREYWTKACDKRLSRLISKTHHTSEYKQYCHVGNTAKQCRLGLFQDSDFEGDLEDSQSTSGEHCAFFGSHTLVPRSWMCKKQTIVSHSSTESVIISLDTGLRLHGISALDLWNLIVLVLGNTT